MAYDCEATRDVLPLVQRGETTAQQAAGAAAHLAQCEECRRERELVRVLANSTLVVPAELEARVVAAVRSRSARRWAPARLAIAATIAAAVIGGSVVFDRWDYDLASRPNPGVLVFDDNGSTAMSWAVSDDPLLHSGSALQQLSVEELELVLAELDS